MRWRIIWNLWPGGDMHFWFIYDTLVGKYCVHNPLFIFIFVLEQIVLSSFLSFIQWMFISNNVGLLLSNVRSNGLIVVGGYGRPLSNSQNPFPCETLYIMIHIKQDYKLISTLAWHSPAFYPLPLIAFYLQCPLV